MCVRERNGLRERRNSKWDEKESKQKVSVSGVKRERESVMGKGRNCYEQTERYSGI